MAPLLVVIGIFLLLLWLGWRYFLGGATLRIEQNPTVTAPVMGYDERENIGGRANPSQRINRLFRLPESVKRYARVWVIPTLSLLLISMVVVITLHFGMTRQNGLSFSPGEHGRGEQIRQALLEEKLVPPPALPPTAFADAVAEKPQLALDKADRDWSKMDPVFVQDVLRVMERMKARGFVMVLLEGYRSTQRQNWLAGGTTKVTQAKGGESKHQYGLAADLAPMRNGKVVVSEQDPWAMQAYKALGEEARAAGLTWGGNWSFRDFGHIERTGPLRKLLAHRDQK